MRGIFFLFGCLVYIAVILACFIYDGGHLESLQPVGGDLVAILLVPLILLISVFGMSRTRTRVTAIFHSNSDHAGATPEKSAAFLSLWIASLYGTAALLFFLRLIILSGFLAGNFCVVFNKAFHCLEFMPMTVFLAEGILRPLKYRLLALK